MINNENNFVNDRNFCGSFYNGVGEISEGDGLTVAIDNDAVEVILDQHGKQLDKYDMRITKLEDITTKILITNAENSVKLSNIENSQLKIEKRLLEYSNEQKDFQKDLIEGQKDFQENLINKLIEKDTSIEIKKTEGKSKIKIQTIITIGAVITTLITASISLYQYYHPVINNINK